MQICIIKQKALALTDFDCLKSSDIRHRIKKRLSQTSRTFCLDFLRGKIQTCKITKIILQLQNPETWLVTSFYDVHYVNYFRRKQIKYLVLVMTLIY